MLIDGKWVSCDRCNTKMYVMIIGGEQSCETVCQWPYQSWQLYLGRESIHFLLQVEMIELNGERADCGIEFCPNSDRVVRAPSGVFI